MGAPIIANNDKLQNKPLVVPTTNGPSWLSLEEIDQAFLFGKSELVTLTHFEMEKILK